MGSIGATTGLLCRSRVINDCVLHNFHDIDLDIPVIFLHSVGTYVPYPATSILSCVTIWLHI